ncbi:hypothetical protein L1887_51336 [Cichorium endivia]|nr:hypothetical protein L1887_51336 [Cichorium endivia]
MQTIVSLRIRVGFPTDLPSLSRTIRLLFLDEADAFCIVTPERQPKSAEQGCRTNHCWQSGDVCLPLQWGPLTICGIQMVAQDSTVWKPKYSISPPRGESWGKEDGEGEVDQRSGEALHCLPKVELPRLFEADPTARSSTVWKGVQKAFVEPRACGAGAAFGEQEPRR